MSRIHNFRKVAVVIISSLSAHNGHFRKFCIGFILKVPTVLKLAGGLAWKDFTFIDEGSLYRSSVYFLVGGVEKTAFAAYKLFNNVVVTLDVNYLTCVETWLGFILH